MSVEKNPWIDHFNKMIAEMEEKGHIFALPSWPRNSGREIIFKDLSVSFPVLPEDSRPRSQPSNHNRVAMRMFGIPEETSDE